MMVEPKLTAVPAPPASATTVHVLFFGPVRVRLGLAHVELTCSGGISVDEFWNGLIQRHPELRAMRATIRLARDGEFLDASARVRPGDEIALIPPVSGG
jgi:molybdopterin converting factor small subunit